MESLHDDNQAGEAAEPGPSSKPASYKAAQVWKDIEAETGFASYTDYLYTYQSNFPDIDKRIVDFKELPEDEWKEDEPSIGIYDLSIQENSTTMLSLRCRCYSGTELLQALRELHEPTGTNSVRLVLWSYGTCALNQEMIETLVLGLKLDPKLIQNLPDVSFRQLTYTAPFKQRRPTPAENFRTHHISSISGDSMIATILQNGVTNEIPVVLIMGRFVDNLSNSGFLEQIVGGREYRTPPVRRSVPEDQNKVLGTTTMGDVTTKVQVYAEIVEQHLQGQDATPTKAFLLLAAMSPLLYVEAYLVNNASDKLQLEYANMAVARLRGGLLPALDDRNLNDGRLELRRTLEATEDLVGQIFRYLGSAAQSDLSKEPSYVSMRADLRILIDDARRLEAEVRDFIQDAISHAAWSESRTSIELSNLQINEAKRGKPAKRFLQNLTLILV